MLIKNMLDVPLEPVQEGISIRWLIAGKDHAPNFAMRVIELAPGAVFKPHHHPSEHEIYVLEGAGIVSSEQGEFEMRPGVVLFVAPEEVHGYRNTGADTLRFICVIPLPA